MKLLSKIALGVVGVLVVAGGSLAVAISYDSPCPGAKPPVEGKERMKAVTARCYGSAEVLRFEEVAKPVPADDEVLVKVHAASVNPLDWHSMRGEPYVMRLEAGFGAPSDIRVGVDFAGTIEAVGKSVTKFKVGDEVFGGKSGALGEYVTIRESRSIVPKPSNITFEEAAAVPIAAVTALQSLKDIAQVKPGQKVLINGSSGGVGTFAVQIAKLLGADVTAVCSTRNIELVRSLGADHIIDYTKQNYTEGNEQYDVIIDNVGGQSLRDAQRVLKPQGVFVMVGGKSDDPWIGPLIQPIKSMLMPTGEQKFEMFFANLSPENLAYLADAMAAKKLTVVIDRSFPLNKTSEAITYLETGRARGKVIVTME